MMLAMATFYQYNTVIINNFDRIQPLLISSKQEILIRKFIFFRALLFSQYEDTTDQHMQIIEEFCYLKKCAKY